MKIKNNRKFLLCFMSASLVFLTGFEKPGANNTFLIETKTASINLNNVQYHRKQSSVKSKQNETRNSHPIANANVDVDPQKTLDLTIPFKVKSTENGWMKIEQNRMSQRESANLFAAEKSQKPLPLDLDGQMLMSQEPEVDKQKSLDGAGIVITLKR
ncbi:MAG: hypothetical protein ACU83U_15445 [Gammaproteobacteria bacterium]